MSLKKELEDLLRSIRGGDFMRSKSEITKDKPMPPAPRERSDAPYTFGENTDSIAVDKRPVEKPDPYQVEVDKINERIRQAKALTPQDMREIEETLARQDIQKDIFRSRMNMASDEARERQKIKEDSEEREKFKAKINSNKNDRRRGR